MFGKAGGRVVPQNLGIPNNHIARISQSTKSQNSQNVSLEITKFADFKAPDRKKICHFFSFGIF